MPELPEVETIVQAMKSGGRGGSPLIGLTVSGVNLLWPRSLAEPQNAQALQHLKGQTIMDISRRGKFIRMDFELDMLFLHLRMSGDIRVVSSPQAIPIEKHDRFVIYFNEQVQMIFQDTRKFGRIWLVKSADEVIGKLGPEPFDEGLDANKFYEKLQACNRQIKPLLMDQSFLAGMGNIYTDEALFAAKIHPCMPSSALDYQHAAQLLQAIRMVLTEGIRRNGSSIDWIYRGGDFQNYFKVYQRTGQACVECGQPIKRILVGQRGTHFCPKCQPEHLNGSKLKQ
jgi:formamidopyrimidine-DNA glycosylase